MKYRVLNPNELEPLRDDFISFLSANTITGEDWSKIKSDKPKEASRLVEIFSDIVWEKSLVKIKYLEHRDEKYLKVFRCGKSKMSMVGFRVGTLGAPSLVDDKTFKMISSGELKFSSLKATFYTSEKAYAKSRNEDIFEMIQSGCLPCGKDYYFGVKSLLK